MVSTIAVVAALLLLNAWLTRGTKSLTPQSVHASIPSPAPHIQPAPAIPIAPVSKLPAVAVTPSIKPAPTISSFPMPHRLNLNVDLSRWMPPSLVDFSNEPDPQTIQTTTQTAADCVQIFFW